MIINVVKLEPTAVGANSFTDAGNKEMCVFDTDVRVIDLELEEHVYLDDEQEVAFDHHGKEIKMPYKMSSRLIESYPRRTLEKTKNNVKKPEITYDAAVLRLTSKLKKSVSIGRRNLEEKITINEIIELYVPIYEARLIGPKKNVRLMRIDSIRKKIL